MKVSTSLSVQYDNPFSPFPGKNWKQGLDWVRDSGFDAVEIILSDPDLLDRNALERKLQQTGLPVSTISTGQAMALEGLSLCSASRETRDRTLRRLDRDMELALLLGKPHVTVGLIRGRGGDLPEDMEWSLLRDSLARLADQADTKGITINLEPINRYECRHLNSSRSALEIIRQIGSPTCIGVLYDTFHSNIEDAEMLPAISELGSRISNVHLADSNRRLPGEGHIDFPAVHRQLEAIGYDGYAALEVLNTPSQVHIRENAQKSIQYFMERAN